MNATGENLFGCTSVPVSGLKLAAFRPLLRFVLGLCAYQIAFYFAYRYGMSFSQASASPFWFPDSVLLCALLLSRPKYWWVFVLAPLPIRLFAAVAVDIPSWFLLTTFAIDSAKGLLTAGLLRRFVRNPVSVHTMREFTLFCLFAVLLIPAAGAFGGATARHLLGDDYWTSWEQWFLGNVLTHLVVTPAILYCAFGRLGSLRGLSTRRWIEGGVLAAGLILTGYFALSTGSGVRDFTEPRFYAPVPFLFWAAIRFGMFGASGAISVIAFLAVDAALLRRGPFGGQAPAETAVALQHFLLLRAVPLYFVAILIEQRTRVEHSLRDSEERFRHLADSAPVLIWMSGTDKKCTYFNRRWLDFTGRDFAQEIGDGWMEHVHPDDVQRRVDGYQAAFDARRPLTVEYRLRRHDGQYRWILAHAVPRSTAEGEFLGYTGSCLDITDRKNDEEALREARQELVHLSRVSMLGALSSALAHELNQPLGSILSNAQAALRYLRHEPPNMAEVTEILRDIASEDQRAGEVIRRMRLLLKRGQPQFVLLDLNDLVNEVVRLMRSELVHRGTTVDLLLGRDLVDIPGDRVPLQQVLINLLFNGADAMQHLPPGRRRLTVRTTYRHGVDVSIAVSDGGVGIEPDDFDRLFKPFFTTKRQGLGIGLAICKSIMDAHGGRLWAENNPHGGATFHVVLPIATPAHPAATASRPEEASVPV